MYHITVVSDSSDLARGVSFWGFLIFCKTREMPRNFTDVSASRVVHVGHHTPVSSQL